MRQHILRLAALLLLPLLANADGMVNAQRRQPSRSASAQKLRAGKVPKPHIKAQRNSRPDTKFKPVHPRAKSDPKNRRTA